MGLVPQASGSGRSILARRRCLAVLMLALGAAAGTVVLVRAWMRIAASGQALAGPVPGFGLETIQACQVDRALVAHSGGYGTFPFNAYPFPYELVLTPMCILPTAVWQLLAAAASLALAGFGLWLWRDTRVAIALLPALLSPLLVQLIQVDQIFTAIGLFGISLAVWAQRRQRWHWLGIGVAISLIRPINALPVLVMLLLATPLRASVRAAALALLAVGLPSAISWAVDPGWVSQYLHLLDTYRMAGIPQVVSRAFGPEGLLIVSVLPAIAGAALADRRPRLGPLSLDRASLALALTVFVAPLQGLYVGVFALPALVRLASRDVGGWIAWFAVIAAWAGILAASEALLGPNPAAVFPFLSVIAYWIAINVYPLVRRRPLSTIRAVQ